MKDPLKLFGLVVFTLGMAFMLRAGRHMPTVYKSNTTEAVVKVVDGHGNEVTDFKAQEKILDGRYNMVWVK